MNNKIKCIVVFVAGAATGSAVTWKLLKTKYERIAQEEIDSVKEVFSRRETTSNDEVESQTTASEEPVEVDPEVTSYHKTLNDLGYTDYSDISKKDEDEEEEEESSSVTPYVITPDEFGWAEGYDTVNLNYYKDGILANDDDEVYDDLDGTVGTDFIKRFGEYEPDIVHVRNDILKIDYEICRDRRTFAEASGQMEEE